MATETSAEKKARLVAEATALGITVEGKNVKALETAIKQSKLGGDEHAPTGEVSSDKLKKGHTIAHVEDESGVIRTYSEDVHGEAFFDHANEFASKVAGRKVVTE